MPPLRHVRTNAFARKLFSLATMAGNNEYSDGAPNAEISPATNAKT